MHIIGDEDLEDEENADNSEEVDGGSKKKGGNCAYVYVCIYLCI
jgi:hypothetical protein